MKASNHSSKLMLKLANSHDHIPKLKWKELFKLKTQKEADWLNNLRETNRKTILSDDDFIKPIALWYDKEIHEKMEAGSDQTSESGSSIITEYEMSPKHH